MKSLKAESRCRPDIISGLFALSLGAGQTIHTGDCNMRAMSNDYSHLCSRNQPWIDLPASCQATTSVVMHGNPGLLLGTVAPVVLPDDT